MNTTPNDIAKLEKLAAAIQDKFPMTKCFVLRNEGKIFKKNRADGTVEYLDLEAAQLRVTFEIGSPHARCR